MSDPITPETHVFKDGQVVLNKDGTPKRKPGRKAKNAAASPPAPAPAPEQAPAPDPAPAPAPVTAAPAAVVATPVAVVKEVAPPPVTVVEPTPVVVAGEPPKKPPSAPVPTLPVTVVAPAPPAKTVAHKQEATVTVTKSYGKIGATEDKQETIEVKTFVTTPATIEMGYGLTLNIGNYESARVDVKVSVPCYREEADAAYEWARTWAEERIKREVKEVRAMAAPAKSNPF